MSHHFGDLLTQHLHRRHGLSQARLAEGIGQSPAVISAMCQGRRLTGQQARERVLAIITWLQSQGTLESIQEADALLAAAGLSPLNTSTPAEAALRQRLRMAVGTTGVLPGEHPGRSLADLPVPPNPLVGRAEEIAQVCASLADPAVRLLTLVGPPGVGKSRLALEVAHRLSEGYEQRVCFVPLASVGDAGQVGPAIAEALEVHRVPGDRRVPNTPSLEMPVRQLADKRYLLVLDNFEHLLSAAPLVAELLARAPGLKVLATSRAALRVSGEHCYEVPPLKLPDLQRLPAPAALLRYAAVELFAQRARMAHPHFTLDRDNAPAVAEVCCRLDGLPLAIELAALRTSIFTPQALLAHLDHHLGATLRVLTVGPRDLPTRQQSLRATLDWSYQLLSGEEQALLRRLAVFAGGCALEAAPAVCGERPANGDSRSGAAADESLVTILQSLIDNSLVQQAEELGGEPRYTLLETVREYALERLEASGEAESIRRRHAIYYANLAGSAYSGYPSDESNAWIARIRVDRHNLYAALAWSHNMADEPAVEWTLAGWVAFTYYLGHAFWGTDSGLQEMWGRLDRIRATGDRVAPAVRAEVLYGFACLACYESEAVAADNERAAVLLREALALRRQMGDRPGVASMLANLGCVLEQTGDYSEAHECFQDAMTIAREHGDQVAVAALTAFLGDLALDRGDFVQAAALYGESAKGLRQSGVRSTHTALGSALSGWGSALELQGAHRQAMPMLEESLGIHREAGDHYRSAWVLAFMGRAALGMGQGGQARQYLSESLGLFREMSKVREMSVLLALLSEEARLQEALDRAARLAGAVAARAPLYPHLRYRHLRCDCQRLTADAQARLGEPAFAAAWAEGQTMTVGQAVAYALQGDGADTPPGRQQSE